MFLCPQIDERQLLVSHRLFERALDRWAQLAVKSAEAHAQQHVRLYSKFRRRRAQGSLKDAARARHWGTWKSRSLTVRVYVDGPRHAEPIEYGSRSYTARGPTPIVPRNVRFLRFYWPRVGRVVFLRRVMHPGNRPYKSFWKATQSAYRVFGQALEHGLESAAREF